MRWSLALMALLVLPLVLAEPEIVGVSLEGAHVHALLDDGRAGIDQVDAIIKFPDCSERRVPLINGPDDRWYSTWDGEIPSRMRGWHHVNTFWIGSEQGIWWTQDVDAPPTYLRPEVPIPTQQEPIDPISRGEHFDLIHVLVEEPVIDVSEPQIISGDIRSNKAPIESASLRIRHPAGWVRNERMVLTSGDAMYGTWQASIDDFVVGTYVIESVTIRDVEGNERTARVRDRSFQVVGDRCAEAPTDEPRLIYVIVEPHEDDVALPALIRLDAAAPGGVRAIAVGVNDDVGDARLLPARRVNGDSTYGTWEVLWRLKEGQTNEVTNVTITTADGSTTLSVSDRKVYVPAPPITIAPEPPTRVEELLSHLDHPYAPALVAFGIAFIAIVVLLLSRDARLRRTQHHRPSRREHKRITRALYRDRKRLK